MTKTTSDKGDGARLRRRFERVVRCGNLFYELMPDMFTAFNRCPRLVPEGGPSFCWQCRKPDWNPAIHGMVQA